MHNHAVTSLIIKPFAYFYKHLILYSFFVLLYSLKMTLNLENNKKKIYGGLIFILYILARVSVWLCILLWLKLEDIFIFNTYVSKGKWAWH